MSLKRGEKEIRLFWHIVFTEGKFAKNSQPQSHSHSGLLFQFVLSVWSDNFQLVKVVLSGPMPQGS